MNNMNEITLDCKIENIYAVNDFLFKQINTLKINKKSSYKLELVVEEILTNIIKHSNSETFSVSSNFIEDSKKMFIQFKDNGIPFNPLEKDYSDFSTDIDKKKIGGLGIFFIKNNVDDLDYQYQNNANILSVNISL